MVYSCIKYIWWHWTSFYLSFWMIWFLQGIFPFLLSSCKQTPLTNKTPECIRCSVTLNQFRSAILNRISSSRAYRYFLSFGQFSMHLLHSEVWYPWKEDIQWLWTKFYIKGQGQNLMIYCAQRCDQKFWFIPAEKKNLSGLVQGNSNLNWKGIYFIYIQSWLFCAIDIYVYFLYLFWVFLNVIKNISVRANSLIIPVNWLKNYFNLSISVKWWQTSGKYSTAGASWNHLLWMRG